MDGVSQGWWCQSIPGDLSRSFFTVYQWKHLVDEKNLGATVVDGMPTWHVTAFATWGEPKKHLAQSNSPPQLTKSIVASFGVRFLLSKIFGEASFSHREMSGPFARQTAFTRDT